MKKAAASLLTALFFPVAALLAAAGCAGPDAVVNIRWRPVDGAPEGVFLLFTPDRRRVVGCCGTNRFFGPASFGPDGQLSVGMLGATRMATPHLRYEQKFLDDLQAVKSCRIDADGHLILLDIDGEVCMKLKKEPSTGRAL
ncbi:MAG: META domain-containing protein [Lentisphaeria bacterium]|nr:META domain-containing protein [Lentisphaeria bacterium]